MRRGNAVSVSPFSRLCGKIRSARRDMKQCKGCARYRRCWYQLRGPRGVKREKGIADTEPEALRTAQSHSQACC